MLSTASPRLNSVSPVLGLRHRSARASNAARLLRIICFCSSGFNIVSCNLNSLALSEADARLPRSLPVSGRIFKNTKAGANRFLFPRLLSFQQFPFPFIDMRENSFLDSVADLRGWHCVDVNAAVSELNQIAAPITVRLFRVSFNRKTD